jgi:hypothetical protein
MTRTWQDNAHEFGALTKQGKDFRLALLVACSVERGRPGPKAIDPNGSISTKVDAKSFAEVALGIRKSDRVLRHLDAWNKMAEALPDQVPVADTLTPVDAETFGEVSEEVQDKFAEVFTSITDEKPTGGRPRDSKPEDAAAIIGKRGAKAVLDEMSTDEFNKLAEAVSKKRAENFESDFAKQRKRKPKPKDNGNDGGADKDELAKQATRLALFAQTEPGPGSLLEINSILVGPKRTHLDAEIFQYLGEWIDRMRMGLDMVERALKSATTGEDLAGQIEDFLSEQ